MNEKQALEILNEAGVALERIDEARGAFSLRKFERVLNAAMREVDQHYLDSKDHKPAFMKDGRSYYHVIKPNDWNSGVTVYVDVNSCWFVEGVVRRLIKELNEKFQEVGINLQGNEEWRYSSTNTERGYVQVIGFNRPSAMEVDPKTGFIKNWRAIGSTVLVNVDGRKMRFKQEKNLSHKIRDNGSRQLTGYSNDDLWVSTDRSRAIIVHTSCIHPAAGVDYSAKLLGPEETKKILNGDVNESVNESWRDDFEEDGLARFHLYLKLYDEDGNCIEDQEYGDPYTYGHDPIDETEIESWIGRIKRKWLKGVLLFSQEHDPKTDKLVIKGEPVIGSEDYFIAKSYDWTTKHGSKCKAWEDVWF